MKFDHGINWKSLCLLLSDWRVTLISLLECFCNSFIFLVPLLLKQKILKADYWEVFLILHFQSLGTLTQFLFNSHARNETWLTKLTEVSNYGKFIFNIFGWDTVKIGIIRAKVDLRICVCLNRTKPWLELNIKFNQYSIISFQKPLVRYNNLWIRLVFKEFNWVSMSKIPYPPFQMESWTRFLGGLFFCSSRRN